MKEKAGERLFEAIGQIPDQMVLEAAQEQDSLSAAAWEVQADEALQLQDPDPVQSKDASQSQDTRKNRLVQKDKGGSDRRSRRQAVIAKLDRYFKYLPVAACLCMVLAGSGYVVIHFIDPGQDSGIRMSGSLDGASDGAGQVTEEEVVMMDQAADTEEGADIQEDLKEDADRADRTQKNTYGTNESASDAGALETAPESQAAGYIPMLPVRYDAYEGPVFSLTATGDTQKLKVSRRLKASVLTQEQEGGIQPLLQVTDTYQLKNTSRQDKTLQLVYPFVTTLNRAFAMEGSMLQVKGQEQAAVTYGIGESIQAYRGADASEPAAMEDYRLIFAEDTNYQEQALAKEADWDRSVHVYTFSDIQAEEGTAAANASGVIGVAVNGAQAEVLTYGFDHSFTREDGGRTYCFFIPQEEKKLLLIVAGEMEGDPELGYYANLDCKEKIAGVRCRMDWREMSYGDALRLCSKDAARKLRQDYERGMYDAELPEYMDEDAAFRVLTMISEEDDFYRVLTQRYETTELTEVFERMFGETRVVYAMATVTIPAKKTIRAVAQTQKRQNAGNYMLPENRGADRDQTYVYDFLSAAQSRLRMKKTDFRLTLPAEWKIAKEDCGLEKKRDGVWKGELLDEDACVIIADAVDGK